jgi:Mycolic acid cyclopropane synthetase
MEIVEIKRETHDYELTMKHWALRFDNNSRKVIEQWGKEIYRAFRMYLWVDCNCLRANTLQAYHLVAQKHFLPGPVQVSGDEGIISFAVLFRQTLLNSVIGFDRISVRVTEFQHEPRRPKLLDLIQAMLKGDAPLPPIAQLIGFKLTSVTCGRQSLNSRPVNSIPILWVYFMAVSFVT